MCFSVASNCALSCFLFFFCLRTLRFLFLNHFSDCFRLVPFPVSESDNRHVYCSTCLFSIFCRVDNSSPNLNILVWMLSASLFTLLTVTMFSLGANALVSFLRNSYLQQCLLRFSLELSVVFLSGARF